MFYNKMNSPKIKIYRVIFNCFLIAAYLISFSSCTTTGLYYVSPGSLESGSKSEIKTIELKNGTVINCTGKIIKIERESDSSAVFVIASGENVKAQDSAVLNAINQNDIRIPEKDVKKIIMEMTREDHGMTTVALAGGVLLVALIIIAADFGNSIDVFAH